MFFTYFEFATETTQHVHPLISYDTVHLLICSKSNDVQVFLLCQPTVSAAVCEIIMDH